MIMRVFKVVAIALLRGTEGLVEVAAGGAVRRPRRDPQSLMRNCA